MKDINLVYSRFENGKPIPNGNPKTIEQSRVFHASLFIRARIPGFKINYCSLDNIDPKKIYFYLVYRSLNRYNFEFSDEEIEKLRNNENIIFIYIYWMEPFTTQFNEIYELKEKLDLPKNRMFYVTGELNAKQNFKNSNHPFNINGFNFWYNDTFHQTLRGWVPTVKENDYKNVRKKHFMCLNAIDRPHRRFLYGMLSIRGIKEHGYCSYLFRFKDLNKKDYQWGDRYFKKVNERDQYYDYWSKNLFPKYLDTDNIDENDRWVDLKYVLDSYINVVTETFFEEPYNNFLFMSEKSYKPFLWKQIPIIVGNKNTLKELKRLGFYTFPEIIDERYDEIEDARERINFIVEEIERICKIPLKELHALYVNAKPKLEHNYSNMFQEDVEKKLSNLFDDIYKIYSR